MTAVSRPFVSLGINVLEKEFDEKNTDITFLNKLLHELSFRRTKRAGDLEQRALSALSIVAKTEIVSRPAKIQKPTRSEISNTNAPRLSENTTSLKKTSYKRAIIDLRDISEPERILLAWSALEVLSPQSYLKPKDLVSGESYRISDLSSGDLPWENGGEKSRPNYRLYYQIILGSIQMEPAVSKLMTVYTDKRAERPPTRGESILATIIVDREGRPVDNDAVALSSFAWGVPIALNGDIKSLGDWGNSEKHLVSELDTLIRQTDNENNTLSLTKLDIQEAYSWLVEKLGLPEELINPPSFAVKSYQWFRIDESPEPLLLNSFFLGDLDKARSLFKEDDSTLNLEKYLAQAKPEKRVDLLHDQAALRDALHPSKIPLGRWPAKGRYPLVALQQAAVNLASTDLETEGILAVNGPPGTGKTTLLRDVVANAVTKRAEVMADFDDPETAFKNTKQRVKKGNAFLWMYELDDRLRGHEIVVASSNNKAVENVSAELPGIDAIAENAFTDGYFKSVSDGLLSRNTWGLAAAVLGNAGNRGKFRQQFWWDDDSGMMRYLQHATGTPAIIKVKDDGNQTERLSHIVGKEHPPADKNEALKKWRSARNQFIEAKKTSRAAINAASKAAELLKTARKTRDDLESELRQKQKLQDMLSALDGKLKTQEITNAKADMEFENHRKALVAVKDEKPSFFVRIFKRVLYRGWKNKYDNARTAFQTSEEQREICKQDLERIVSEIGSDKSNLQSTQRNINQIRSDIAEIDVELIDLQEKLGGQFIDENYFNLNHDDRQKAIPWLDAKVSRHRDNVFEKALLLHKAFIGAAARPLKHNLGLLMDSFGVRSFGTAEKDKIIPHLWSSLFLVVPAVSTTFASVGRMFARIEPNELGWLLIDEAGQALPQAAVGAIMRTKRAVIVGDPLQIEPVVVLPEQLTEAICKEFQIDETKFNAPAASAQTLADSATAYYASFETKFGSRDVGVPLLVHRRCADPMFSISNAVAYEHLMVQAKANGHSKILDVLGPSRWHHVEGDGQDKWCAKEGDVVLDLLKQLKSAGVVPDIYIVTPFVVVQNRLRMLIRQSGILDDWVENSNKWPYERIGTVHTVQGREAEAVIFVLGAPLATQTGARNWAGGRPNLLNVAVSRAKEALYVVGNQRLWEKAGVFSELSSRL